MDILWISVASDEYQREDWSKIIREIQEGWQFGDSQKKNKRNDFQKICVFILFTFYCSPCKPVNKQN